MTVGSIRMPRQLKMPCQVIGLGWKSLLIWYFRTWKYWIIFYIGLLIYTCQYIVMKSCRHRFFYVPGNSKFWQILNHLCFHLLKHICINIWKHICIISWSGFYWFVRTEDRFLDCIMIEVVKMWIETLQDLDTGGSGYWYRHPSWNFHKISLNLAVHRKINVCMTSWRYIDAYR